MKNPLDKLVRVVERRGDGYREVVGSLTLRTRARVLDDVGGPDWIVEEARRRVVEEIASVLYGPVVEELGRLAHELRAVEPAEAARWLQNELNFLRLELLRPVGRRSRRCAVTVTPPVTPRARSK